MPADEKNPAQPPGNPLQAHLAKLQAAQDDLLARINRPRLNDGVLFSAAQRLIKEMPPREAFIARVPAIAEWVGEASMLMERWNPLRAIDFRRSIDNIGTALDFGDREYAKALGILHEARYDVELRAEVPTAGFVDKGQFHGYFEQVRSLVQQAKTDLLITDRYLNADFVARYLPFVTKGARVRLLVRRPEPTLLPALGPAAAQYALPIEARAHDQVHDRFLFIDGIACHHSGASFADGGKTGPTIVAQIIDFVELRTKYEALWSSGAVLR